MEKGKLGVLLSEQGAMATGLRAAFSGMMKRWQLWIFQLYLLAEH